MISAVLSPQSQLKRGVMNRLDYQVKNSDSHPLNGLRLQVEIAGNTYSSAPFDLAPGQTRTIPVIVGGADTLPEMVNLTQRLQHTAATGERAEVVRNQALITGTDTLSLRLESKVLTRGTRGEVRFVLENSSEVETDILLSRPGNSASNEVRLLLQDSDGNLLAAAPLQQSSGEGVLTLSDGRAVARLTPGGVLPPAGAASTSPPAPPTHSS